MSRTDDVTAAGSAAAGEGIAHGAAADGAGPLAGKRVVVTRARAQSLKLIDSLAALGAEVVELPLIEIVHNPDNDTVLAGELAVIDTYDWLIVTSPNGAACVVEQHASAPARCRVAAVGSATARALAPFAGADFVPARADAAGLVAEFPIEPSGRALLVQGDLAPSLIADHLTGHGWAVRRLAAYSTVATRPGRAAIDATASADAITFLSSSAVQAFADVIGLGRLPPVVVSIGASTTLTLRELGVTDTRQAAVPTLNALVTAVSSALQ